MPLQVHWDEVPSPIGRIRIAVRDGRICAVSLGGSVRDFRERLKRRFGHFGEAELHRKRNPAGRTASVQAYFAGDLNALDGIPVDPGGTVFQKTIWRLLRKLRPGQVISYGALARKAGSPQGARAVGRAVGENPIPIVIPCHRVVTASEGLGGYSAGVDRKRWLLRHERESQAV